MSCADDDKDGPVTPAEGGAAGSAGVTGGGGANPDPEPVRVHLSGSAQKGPLVAGSSVNVYGLDSELEPTGTVFPSQTEDSLGSFDVSANLTEELVEVVVQGAFYDELTGSLSETGIVLSALAAATSDTDLQVNLLTTASKKRIRYLVHQGKQFDAAVARAEEEVLSAFGIEDDSLEAFTAMDITGSTASDAALIALSAILLQYADDHSDADGEKVAQLGLAVTTLGSDLEEDGVLDDTALGRGIAAAAARLDVAAVTANLDEIYSGLGQSIDVPEIEPFVAAVAELAPWHFGTSMPVARHGHCACAVDDKVYVMGGSVNAEVFDDVLMYDLATDQWSHKAKMLMPRTAAACSVVDGIIYVTGGVSCGQAGCTAIDSDVEAYDPAADAWTVKQAMPNWQARRGDDRENHASTTVGGMIYVIGGSQSEPTNGRIDSVLVYDPVQDTWEPVAPLPTPLSLSASATLSGRLYVFGGVHETDGHSGPSPLVYEYDPMADAWTPRAPMGTARAHATAIALDGRIYVIGGWNEEEPVTLGTVEEYDPSTDSWSTKAAMNVPRYAATGVLMGDLAYVIGGNTVTPGVGSYDSAIVETYDPTKDQ